jgi:hypothetical protein
MLGRVRSFCQAWIVIYGYEIKGLLQLTIFAAPSIEERLGRLLFFQCRLATDA